MKVQLLLVVLPCVLSLVLAQEEALNQKNKRNLATFSGSNILDDFLDGKTWGGANVPGPCPSFAQRCTGDIENAPDYVKAIKVTVPVGVSLFGGVQEEERRIDQVVKEGVFDIWNLALSQLELDELTFDSPSLFFSSAGVQDITRSKLTANNLGARINANIRGSDMVVNVFGLDVSIAQFDGTMIVDTAGIVTEFGLEFKSEAGLGQSNSGANPNLDFTNNFPDRFDFTGPDGNKEVLDRSGNGACNLVLPDNGIDLNGVSIDLNLPFPFDLFINLVVNLVIDIVIQLLKGFIEGIFCEVVVQLAYIKDNNNLFSALGGINVELGALYDLIRSYDAEGLRDSTDVRDAETFLLSAANPFINDIEPEKAINFKTNGFFEGLSFGLNNILGGPSTNNPPYDFVINEVVDRILESTTGEFNVPDVQAKYGFSDADVTFTQVFDAGGARVKFKGFRLGGLNTFGAFKILDNNFKENPTQQEIDDRFEYSLTHNILLNQLSILLVADVQLLPGIWVNVPNNPSASDIFTVEVELSLSDLDVQAATFLLLQPELLEGTQIGQVLGPDADPFGDCIAKVLDHLNLTKLSVSYTLDNIRIESQENDPIDDLIGEAVSLINAITEGGLREQLDTIIENGVRPALNSGLEPRFVDPDGSCPAYVSQVYSPESFQVADTLFFGAFSDAFENTVGGDPISPNDADINSILDVYIEYFFIDDPTEDPLLIKNGRGNYEFVDKLDIKLRTQDDFFNAAFGGLIVNDFDSISSFVISPIGTEPNIDPYAANAVFQWGHHPIEDPPPIAICFPVVLNATLDNEQVADENFCVQLNVAFNIDFTLAAEIDIDRTFQLTFGEIQNLACIFAVLNAKELRSIELEVFETFSFSLAGSFSDTPLGRNLSAIEASSGSVPRNFVDYLLNRVEVALTDTINAEFDPPYDIATCATAESPLGNTSFGSPVPEIDLTSINELLAEATVEQPNPRTTATAKSFEENIVPPGGKVFDVTSDAYEFISILSKTINEESVKNALVTFANTTVDPDSPSIFDPIIEVLSLPNASEEAVTLSIDMSTYDYDPEVEGLIEGLKVKFRPITVENVESFDEILIIQPFEDITGDLANFTTVNDFKYQNSDPDKLLKVTFGVDIEVAGVVIGDPTPILTESITVSFEVTGVDIEVLWSVAVDPDKLSEILMGDLLEYDFDQGLMVLRGEGLNCTLPQTIYPGGFHFPQIQWFADASAISSPRTSVSGTLFSEDLLGAVDSFLDIFIRAFSKELPNFTQGPVRQIINQAIADQLLLINERTCKDFEIPDFSGLPTGRTFNFETSILSEEIDFFIKNDLLDPGKPLDINDLLQSNALFLDEETNTPGIGKFTLDPINILYNNQDLGTATAALGAIQFPGLGSPYNAGDDEGVLITGLQVLKRLPQYGANTPRRVFNSIKFEGLLKVDFRIAYSFDGLFEPSEDAPEAGNGDFLPSLSATSVYNDLIITLEIENPFLGLEIDIGMDMERFLNASAGNLLNLYDTPSDITCYLSIFEREGLVPLDFTFNFTEISFEIACASVCNSPQLLFLSGGAGAATPAQVNQALTNGLEALIEILEILIADSDAQGFLNAAIETAREECIGEDLIVGFTLPEAEKKTDAAYYMGLASMSFFFTTSIFLMTCIPRHKRRRQAILRNAAKLKADGNDIDLTYVQRKMLPLVNHPTTGPIARFFVPAILGIATVLFITANFLTVGASVGLRLTIFGDTTPSISLLDFTLAISINDAWNAEAYPLAIAIAVASGFWPYLKLVLLYCCWLAPATVLSVAKRGSLALWLDVLGKWSLIDAYVLIILQVGFRFFISSSTVSQLDFLDDDLVVVDVVVQPGFGIFGFVLGTMVSLVINHYVIHCHRKAVDADEQVENQTKGYANTANLKTRKTRISRHRFFIDDDKYSYGYGRGVQVIVIFLLGLSLLLVTIGLFLPILRLEFGGIVGIMIAIIDSDSSTTIVSSFEITSLLADGAATDTKTQMGILFLQLVYIIFIAITPLGLIALFAIGFFGRLTLREQKTIVVLSEIVFAWEALLILIVSYIGAVFQISQLAAFIADSATGDLCGFVEDQLIGFGLDASDAKCLDVTASIEGSGYVLIFGTFILGITTIVMNRLLHTAVHDRELLNKYKVARKAENKDQMQQLQSKGHHPLKYKGFIIGPLLRAACVKYRRRRTAGQTFAAETVASSTFSKAPHAVRAPPAPTEDGTPPVRNPMADFETRSAQPNDNFDPNYDMDDIDV